MKVVLKKMVAAGCGVALTVTLAGCSSGDTEPSDEGAQQPVQEQKAEPTQEPKSEKDFDGSAFTDTGEGIMYLRTPGGTTEGGNVPEIAVSDNIIMMQISLCTEGMDGSVCTLYVDGAENTTLNAGERMEQMINLDGDALKAGTHMVELVKIEGEVPVIYKKAEYKAV